MDDPRPSLLFRRNVTSIGVPLHILQSSTGLRIPAVEVSGVVGDEGEAKRQTVKGALCCRSLFFCVHLREACPVAQVYTSETLHGQIFSRGKNIRTKESEKRRVAGSSPE